MRKMKTMLLLLAMHHRWLAGALMRLGRQGRDALRDPDPHPGDASRWEFLSDLHEMSRYAVLVGYIRRLHPQASVLDVGSSSGVLAEELRHDVRRYCGLELDPSSVARARQRNLPHADFIVGDANAFQPREKFDVIVFNETLYYLQNPLEVLRRYAQFLNPGGTILVSNYVAKQLLKVPSAIADHFHEVDRTLVMNGRGTGWIIQAITRRDCPHSTATVAECPERGTLVA